MNLSLNIDLTWKLKVSQIPSGLCWCKSENYKF
jgi:hypothetical protein